MRCTDGKPQNKGKDQSPYLVPNDLVSIEDIEGLTVVFSDDHSTCGNCSTVFETQANCFDWTPDYREVEGDYLCTKCADECENPSKEEIIEHAAEAMFACAWADHQDESEDGMNLSGCEIMDVMPSETPEEYKAAATNLVEDVEKLNGSLITAILERAQDLPDKYADRECDEEQFGHYLAMQAMGTGVGLESVCDDTKLDLKLPHTEAPIFED